LWLHSLKVAQLLRSAACLHTNQSQSYLNHLVLRQKSWPHLAENISHLLSYGLESNLCAGVTKTEAEREVITNDYLENNSFSLLCTVPSPGKVQLAPGILYPVLCESTKI